ncbi:hypothetical protein IJT17_06710 [bacterium]|nr:hypothetical protein [bacterium]
MGKSKSKNTSQSDSEIAELETAAEDSFEVLLNDEPEASMSDESNVSAQKTRRGRGKASGDLKLSSEMLASNKVMQEKFIMLREAIFAPENWTRQERVRAQRHELAQTLHVHDKLIRAIEKTSSTLPATVLFALIKHYNLSADYFVLRETALSEHFVLEQKIKEFEYRFASSSPTQHRSDSGRNRNGHSDVPRRGGWLKGLPRKAKDNNDAYLLALWQEAKRRNYSPSSVNDMIQWAQENSIRINASNIAVHSPERQASKPELRRRTRTSGMRRGGWMLGLPRSPRTDEQKEQVRIWRIAQELGLRFNSVNEMMAWWLVEGQKISDK